MADNQATLDAINYHKAQLYDLLDMARAAGILTEETNVAIVRVSDLKRAKDLLDDLEGAELLSDLGLLDTEWLLELINAKHK